MISNQVNRKVKCVLIEPPDVAPYQSRQNWIQAGEQVETHTYMHEVYPPLGLTYIASFLRENGVDVKIIDGRPTDVLHEGAAKMAADEAPDFVGISAMTPKINSALYLAKMIKEASPETKIILGGPHIRHDPVGVAKNDAVDFCVLGEGEITALNLINTVSGGGNPGDVKGIAFKKGSDVTVTPPRPLIQDLDSLPFPARDLLDNPVYAGEWTGGSPFASVLATRGCPFACGFCDERRSSYRRRSPENVLDEIEEIHETYNIDYVRFVDDLFITNRKWAMDVCRGWIERGLDSKVGWCCDARVDLVTEELLTEMRKANCLIMFFGIEFGNQRILDFVQKETTIPKIKRAIDMTSKSGISSYGYFMMGYPTETVETIEDTINLALDLSLNHGLEGAGFSIVTPYPGTPLYDYCKANGMLKSEDWGEYSYQLEKSVIELEHLTEEQLVGLYRRANIAFKYKDQLQQTASNLVPESPTASAPLWGHP